MSETLEMKPASEEELREALMDVVDPELGIDVVNLGLIYGIHVDDANIATVDMTLTSAACPLTDVIEDQAKSATDGLVSELRINWVWMPPWGRQDHGRRPRAAARAGVQRLSSSTSAPHRQHRLGERRHLRVPPFLMSAPVRVRRYVRSYTWDTCSWPEPSPPRSPAPPP